VEFESALTWADVSSSTIHSPYNGNEMRNRVLRRPLGEENP
jgi:hypothetical protein